MPKRRSRRWTAKPSTGRKSSSKWLELTKETASPGEVTVGPEGLNLEINALIAAKPAIGNFPSLLIKIIILFQLKPQNYQTGRTNAVNPEAEGLFQVSLKFSLSCFSRNRSYSSKSDSYSSRSSSSSRDKKKKKSKKHKKNKSRSRSRSSRSKSRSYSSKSKDSRDKKRNKEDDNHKDKADGKDNNNEGEKEPKKDNE